MLYAIQRADGVVEVREDSYPLPSGAVLITQTQADGLLAGTLHLVNGVVQ